MQEVNDKYNLQTKNCELAHFKSYNANDQETHSANKPTVMYCAKQIGASHVH